VAVPTFAQLITLSSNVNGLVPESLIERLLTVAAMLASGTGPDGTPLPGGGGLSAVPSVFTPPATQIGGDITGLGSVTTWQEIAAQTGGPGTGGLDLSIAAAVGDVLLCINSVAVGTTATTKCFDFLSVNNGSVTISGANLTAADFGVGGWEIQSSNQNSGGSDYLYTVVAGDISGGNVKMRPYVRTTTATGTTLFRSQANGTAMWGLVNLKH
jgi:hypothetical protein